MFFHHKHKILLYNVYREKGQPLFNLTTMVYMTQMQPSSQGQWTGMHMHNDNFTVLVSGVVDAIE